MHCKGLLEDLTRISTRCSNKGLQKMLPKIFMPAHKMVIAAAGEDLTRSWHKNLPRASQKSFHRSTSNSSARSSCKGLLGRISPGSPQDLLLMQGPLKEDLTRISTGSSHEDPCKITQGRMSARSSQDLLISTCTEIQDHARTSDKNSSRSSQHLLTRTSTRPWSRSSNITDLQGCDMKRLFAPHHDESDPTRPKCQEGCTRDIKSRTAPQRERSDTPKVTRGLRERYQNSHRTTTRAIRHAQSHETLARARVRFSQIISRTTKKWTLEMSKIAYLPRVSGTFCSRTAKYCACHEKWARGVRSATVHLPHGIIIMSQINNDDSFTNLWPFRNIVQVHQILRMTHTCQRFSNVQKVPHLPRRWKVPDVLHKPSKKRQK